jgi:hypothetical protein
MKLILFIVESSHKEELEVILNRNDIVGYTEIPLVHGSGLTGLRMGSRAFPHTSSIVFTVLSTEAVGPLVDEIKRYCKECMERMKIIIWGVEEIL